jgi:glycosyltransferase involved in cell wall biosynthesis
VLTKKTQSRDISIVIPTFREGRYLRETLQGLRAQTAASKAEIVVADYNPDHVMPDLPPEVKYVDVDRKGIAYARHKGIMASSGKVILNFDADARFDDARGIEYMTAPILRGECVLTCCDNVFDLRGLNAEELEKMRVPLAACNMLCHLQRTTPVACLEPGSAISRAAYDFVGGYNDVPYHELFHLSNRILIKYLPMNIRHIFLTNVYVSPRRAKKFIDRGISVLDYSNKAYR